MTLVWEPCSIFLVWGCLVDPGVNFRSHNSWLSRRGGLLRAAPRTRGTETSSTRASRTLSSLGLVMEEVHVPPTSEKPGR